MDKPLIVIPAAGFGTRMGLSPTQSKELLQDPYNDNKPLIQWSLDLTNGYNRVIVTREDKSDLIDYMYSEERLQDDKIFVSLITDVCKEWPNSVLHSEPHWEEKNILILPDTRFQPLDIVSKIEQELETNDIVFACHKIEDCRQWGKVLLDPFISKPLATIEKEGIEFKLEGLAWGIIGFRNNIGKELFTHYLNKTRFNLTNKKVSVILLERFKDITRTGIIEEY